MKMITLMLLLIGVWSVSAQAPPSKTTTTAKQPPIKEAPQDTPQPAPGPKFPFALGVEAKSLSTPILKYSLLPELKDMKGGNAAYAYLKSFAEQNLFFNQKETLDERERLLTCPLSDIKPGSLKGYGWGALKQADFAARLDYVDWNLLPQLQENGYNTLLPDVQQLRSLGRALALRCRGQIVDGDFDGAIRTLQTQFALAHHLTKSPTAISSLVALAIANDGLARVEELIQQPGAPNLYWALTALPKPFVELQTSISGERMMAQRVLGKYGDPQYIWQKEDYPAVEKHLAIYRQMFTKLNASEAQEMEKWLRARVVDEAWIKEARLFLKEHGYPEDKIALYPPQQVLIFKLYTRFIAHLDESLSRFYLPYPQGADLAKQIAADDWETKIAQKPDFVDGVRTALARFAQRVEMLRLVEAIRASTKDGKLPTALAELVLPQSPDPVTGKPFDYAVVEGKGVLKGGATRPISNSIMANPAEEPRSYEIKLRPAK
jgi:hypothetical protein